MVTSTSPKSSVGADADPHTGFLPPSDSEESASETEFRLVAPPRLAVVNVPERDNAVGGVGVQLGLRMHMQRVRTSSLFLRLIADQLLPSLITNVYPPH